MTICHITTALTPAVKTAWFVGYVRTMNTQNNTIPILQNKKVEQ